MKPCILFLLFLLFATLFACQKSPVSIFEEPLAPHIHKILFLGHTYQWGKGAKIDPRLERLDYAQCDQIWLGGDICVETTRKYSTLSYIDSFFDLSNEKTHWAVGNHDVVQGNLNWISEFTQRPLFYTVYQDGFTLMVLNTNLYEPECNALNVQFDMIQAVTDSISQSSHLVILTHHIVWGDVDASMDMWKRANANKPFWLSRCAENTKFHQVIYPMLKAVQARGVQVLCIAGDYGQKDKAFEFETAEGVWFLASGINNSQEKEEAKRELLPKDKILLLEHDVLLKTMEWQFLDLDSLLN